VALLACAATKAAQEPSAELVSLMDLGFYDQNGGFFADGLCLVFPPDGERAFELVIRDQGGAVMGKAGLQVQGWSGMPVFDGLGSSGNPVIQLAEPGDYVLSVDMDGKPITSLSFTLGVEASDDPFDPRKTFHREGPWRELAFLASPAGKPDRPLSFSFWTGSKEIPRTGSKVPQASVRVMLGDELVALYKDPVSVSGTKWRRYGRDLVTPEEPRGKHALTLEKLLARDGEYTVVVESGERVVKTYPLGVTGGKVRGHPRTSLATQPHTDYIVPKFVDRSSRSIGEPFDAFWLESEDARK